MALYKGRSFFRKIRKTTVKQSRKGARRSYVATERRKFFTPFFNPTVKAIVKKEIARQAENKVFNVYQANANIYPYSNASFINSVIPLTPYAGFTQIEQGVGQSQRIGNRIKIKSLLFKYVIQPLGYNESTNGTPRPTHVILWFYHARNNPTEIVPPGNDFLQLGGSSTSLSNSMTDVIAPVNNDEYRLFFRKVHKIGFADNSGTGVHISNQSYTNNDYKLSVSGYQNLTKHIVQNVVFPDNSSFPTTRGLFVIAQAVAVGANYTGGIIPCKWSYTIDTYYEDM